MIHAGRGHIEDSTVCLAVPLQEIACNTVDLHGQLSGGADDQHACAVARLELCAVQQLYRWYEESQRFARACTHATGLSVN